MDSVGLEGTDWRLAHALQIDGRAPFSRIADVLGVSDQTIARRYRRLRTADVLRVVGAVDAARLGYAYWLIRVACTPDAAATVAGELARRVDTTWVHLLSGGTEISALLRTDSLAQRDELLLNRLRRTSRVVSVTAHMLLHIFTGEREGWQGLQVLTPVEVAALTPPSVAAPDAVTLDDGDRRLLEALGRDGRTPHAALARTTGWSESTVRRRMEALRASGILYFDLDVVAQAVGRDAEARLWMSVPPSELARVGRAVARHPEVAFAAATTGPTNLVASVLCRDAGDLYHYLTERIGALTGIRDVETAPVIRTVKRAGAVLPIGPR